MLWTAFQISFRSLSSFPLCNDLVLIHTVVATLLDALEPARLCKSSMLPLESTGL